MKLLKKILHRIRVLVRPTEMDLAVRGWMATDAGDERLRYEFELDSSSVVLDVGGYRGQWASDIFARYGCRVVICEPVSIFSEKIKTRFKKNPKIEVHQVALGRSARTELISVCEDGSSTLRNNGSKETIRFVEAKDFLGSSLGASIDLVKINIEGGEYELMPVLIDTGWIRRIRYVLVQFHEISPTSESEMEAIWEKMKETHRLLYRYKYVWECWERKEEKLS